MKKIGVLGGLGPQATMDFEARLHRAAQRLVPQNRNEGYPPLLLEAAEHLGAWADFLVIVSNGVHAYQEEIEKAAGCKVLSMIDVTMDEVQRRGLKKVGILDYRSPAIGVYNRRLDERGIAWEALPEEQLDALLNGIVAVDEGRESDQMAQAAREGIDYLRARNTDRIVIACTEIALLLKAAADDPNLINPAQLLAEAAVHYSLS